MNYMVMAAWLIIVDVMTDNKNRISSEMRIATNKRGGTIASPGAGRI